MNQTVLIDSFGWVEYFAAGPLAKEYAKYIESATPKTHFAPTIVVYETYKRLKREKGLTVAERAVGYISMNTKVVGLDSMIALKAADISLEKKLAMADAIVKATAELFNAKLITSDDDFEGMENVVYIK